MMDHTQEREARRLAELIREEMRSPIPAADRWNRIVALTSALGQVARRLRGDRPAREARA